MISHLKKQGRKKGYKVQCLNLGQWPATMDAYLLVMTTYPVLCPRELEIPGLNHLKFSTAEC